MITKLNYSGKAVDWFSFRENCSTKSFQFFTGYKTAFYDDKNSLRRIRQSVEKQYRKQFYNVQKISVVDDGLTVSVMVDIWE